MIFQQAQPEDDPRLAGHATVYDPERGGHYPPQPQTDEEN